MALPVLPVLTAPLLCFAGCVALGFTVEAAIGFGGTLISVGLGVLFLPLTEVLSIFLPLNLGLSLTMLLRTRKDLDGRFLLRKLVPFMAPGIPLGLWLSARMPASPLKRFLGAFLVLFSLREFVKPPSSEPSPRRRLFAPLLLFIGGTFHGAFATGGPLVVFVASGELRDKAAFRATLTALWCVLNGAVIATFAVQGNVNASTLKLSLLLAPLLFVAVWLGELLHRRVSPEKFRVAIQVLLLAVGVSLLVRG
ncbi:MAG: sulfite exporter TauE/SafE family protein [Polyangiaceae bacterium]